MAAVDRSNSRKRVLLPGLIVHGHGAFTCDCVLRDVSPTGARIIIREHVQIPERFYLINIRDGVAHDAYRIWGKGRETGVKFESVIPLAANADPAFQRLRQLWLAKVPR